MMDGGFFLQITAAFAGGLLGALIGGLPVFIICGLSAVGGSLIFMATGDSSFLTAVTWGPFLGPHVAFSAAAAAAAYAAKTGRLDSGRNILMSLAALNAPDILLMGGLFGVLGFLINASLAFIPAGQDGASWINSIAVTVLLTGFITRIIFGKTGILGKPPECKPRWSPLHDQDHFPWHVPPRQLLLITAAYGIPAVFTAKVLPDSPGLIFGLFTVSLIFLQFGIRVPVAHHIILSAEIYTLAGGNPWWGMTFALLAAFLGEFFAELFLIHGDTHIDPPAAALAITYSLLPLLIGTGILSASGVIPILSMILIGAGGYFGLHGLRTKAERKVSRPAD